MSGYVYKIPGTKRGEYVEVEPTLGDEYIIESKSELRRNREALLELCKRIAEAAKPRKADLDIEFTI